MATDSHFEPDKDELAAAAIAAGKTWQEAAEAAGLSLRTITRRMADEAFRRRVAELQSAIISQATGSAAGALVDAINQLKAIAQNGEKDGDRIKASIALVDLLIRLRREGVLEERLRRLEDVMEVDTR